MYGDWDLVKFDQDQKVWYVIVDGNRVEDEDSCKVCKLVRDCDYDGERGRCGVLS